MSSPGSESTFTYSISTSGEVIEFGAAYGFCRGQQLSARALGEAIPAKAAALELELARFDLATGGGCKETERALKAHLEGLVPNNSEVERGWFDFTSTLDRGLADHQRKAYPQGLDKSAADSFVEELTARRKGRMDQEILGTILSASREIRQHPEKELSNGFREIFATTSLPKARGVNIQLKVPVSWKGKDGDGPHVLQKWTSKIDTSGATAMLILIAIPASPAELLEIESEMSVGAIPQEVQQVFPAGAVVESTNRLDLMFKPAMRATFTLRSQLSERVVTQRNHFYLAQAAGGVVFLQCGIATPGDASELPTLLKRYTHTCEIVASSMLDLSLTED